MAGSVENVYAQALLEIGREDGNLKELHEEIQALSGIFDENRDFARLLSSPSMTPDEKTKLLKSVFEGRISASALNFLCVLAEKNRCAYLGKIAAELKKGYYDDAGIAEVTVTTAVPLKDGARERLIEKLSRKYDKTIDLVEKTDPAIIGGMIVVCGDNMLDGSVRTKLENMQKQIRDMAAD